MEECPVHYALSILNGKWKLQIVWFMIQQESIRFNELQRKVKGISAIMLSQNLKELEEHKILIRKQYDQMPPKVEYSLTKLGRQIKPALDSLGLWGTAAYNEIEN